MIVPTPRLLFLTLAGTVPIALAGTHSTAILVAVLWLLGAAIVAAVDWQGVQFEGIVWTRQHEPKLSLGAWNSIELRMENSSARVVRFQVRDVVPPLLQPAGNAGESACPAGQSWSLQYRVYPIQRGDYRIGPISGRYLGPLGLTWRRWSFAFDDLARVYPNLKAVGQYEAFVRRGQLQELGLRNSRRWGAGTEFERLRDYTPDDEYRRISWKATARRHMPVVVDYETERSQNIILAIDAGRLMSTKLPLRETPGASRLAAQPLTRLDHAVNAALMLSYVSEGVGDKVGLIAFSDRVQRFLTPRSGRGQFLKIADALYDVRAEPTEADYAEALSYLSSRIARRSLVILFTDLGASESGAALARTLAAIGRRHLCLVVTLSDPAINALAYEPVESVDDIYRKAVARTWLDERDLVLRSLRLKGALTVDTSADAISTDVINRYLEIKSRAAL